MWPTLPTSATNYSLGTGFGVITDFVRGPDGNVYAVSFRNREVYRILRPTGDYNDDGAVNAADYVVWRKTDGTPEGYNTWRANFGKQRLVAPWQIRACRNRRLL